MIYITNVENDVFMSHFNDFKGSRRRQHMPSRSAIYIWSQTEYIRDGQSMNIHLEIKRKVIKPYHNTDTDRPQVR